MSTPTFFPTWMCSVKLNGSTELEIRAGLSTVISALVATLADIDNTACHPADHLDVNLRRA